MPEYSVTWEIDLDAADPGDAAREAQAIQRDANAWATVFTVHTATQTITVDLDAGHHTSPGDAVPHAEDAV
ncbi:hypothetical protein GCM10012285_60270 [Streptomyces kronopolitis]|uniref:Uncharacterized protein n=1 Tax=Streptomyces kronopolitis TaxID=1612435 RepID=A0ABQ2K1J8_9ACTN|nr:hypothetical protein [Streptomyces kronopolitis]GGN61409.1 hypothetical protein GCM10012285_60270 [Streptomyces kronopolitis]